MDLHRDLPQYNKLRAVTSIRVTNNEGVVNGVSKESFSSLRTKKESNFSDSPLSSPLISDLSASWVTASKFQFGFHQDK